MKKIIALTCSLFIGLFLTACGNAQAPKKAATTAKPAQQSSASAQAAAPKKVLIAYFSYSGNTESVAKMIQAKTSGDLFKIETVTPYPQNYDDCVKQASQEQKENARPKLKAQVNNIADYDVVFIGYPNWWGTMPQALFTFIESHNLSGKTVIPFVTHEGSSWGRSLDDLGKLCASSKILEGFTVRGKKAASSQEDVNSWLDKLNLSGK